MSVESFRGPGGASLYYRYDDFTDPWEKRPIVILAHGHPRNSNMWYAWVPGLARDFRVVRPDLRGLGFHLRDEIVHLLDHRLYRFALRQIDPGLLELRHRIVVAATLQQGEVPLGGRFARRGCARRNSRSGGGRSKRTRILGAASDSSHGVLVR